MNTVSVVLIEDDEVIRNSYAFLIEQSTSHEVTGRYASFEEAEKELKIISPDVLLLDIELPGLNGVEAIPFLKTLLPSCHILMLTVFEKEELILKALKNGASGFLTKNTSSKKIISAIDDVMAGGGPMSSSVASVVIKSFQKNKKSPLSIRETEILENIASGKTRIEIAKQLYIEVETIKSHLKNIYIKLDVHTKADAINVARKKRFF